MHHIAEEVQRYRRSMEVHLVRLRPAQQGRTRNGGAGQGRAGAGQGRAGQGRGGTGQGKAGQGRAELTCAPEAF